MSLPDNNVTIKDLARECGVSATTVSLALRNHPRISNETKEIVREAAKRLNYKRNPMISALMTSLGQSRQFTSAVPLAVLYTHEPEQIDKYRYHRMLWEGMSRRAEELGFKLERFFLNSKLSGRRMTQILTARGISGVIIPPLFRAGGHITMDWSQFSSVAVGYSMLSPNLHRVCPNQYQSIRMAMRELKRIGYKRPGLVLNMQSDLRAIHLWSSGFYGFEHAQKPRGIIPVFECNNVEEAPLMSWYKKYQPDVIISSDRLAANVLQSAGVQIPEDVGLVTLSGWEAEGEFAGIDQNEAELGRVAVEQLVQLLYYNERGVPAIPYVIQVPCGWGSGPSVRKHVDDEPSA